MERELCVFIIVIFFIFLFLVIISKNTNRYTYIQENYSSSDSGDTDVNLNPTSYNLKNITEKVIENINSPNDFVFSEYSSDEYYVPGHTDRYTDPNDEDHNNNLDSSYRYIKKQHLGICENTLLKNLV